MDTGRKWFGSYLKKKENGLKEMDTYQASRIKSSHTSQSFSVRMSIIADTRHTFTKKIEKLNENCN